MRISWDFSELGRTCGCTFRRNRNVNEADPRRASIFNVRMDIDLPEPTNLFSANEIADTARCGLNRQIES